VNGFLYEPGDVSALSRHLQVLADPALRACQGEASRTAVRAAFTESRMLQSYSSQFQSLIASDRGG